jgi:acyl-coenzyme A synthetase/AMP-(fatty) acid ligase
MLMADTPEFVTVYLAAMRIGAIPALPCTTGERYVGLVPIVRCGGG